MSEETRGFITWMLATALAMSTLLGLLVRFVLLPYLREHLIAPVEQVKKQVSENHHSNKKPTVLDRIDDVQQEVKGIGKDVAGIGKQVEGLAGVVEAHAEVQAEHGRWSNEWTARIEKDVAYLKGRVDGGNST